MNALITGGTKGVGKATSELLQSFGWNVVCWGRQELFTPDIFASRLLDSGWIPDALVLCAGEWFSKPEVEQSWWDYEHHLGILGNHWRLMHRLLPFLERTQGCVIGVASTRAFIGGVETGPYSVAKAGLVAMMQGYAREYNKGIRFNCVCSGLVDTELGAEVVRTGGAKPGAPMLKPEDVARVIVGLIEKKNENGKVVRIVADRGRSPDIGYAEWVWTGDTDR